MQTAPQGEVPAAETWRKPVLTGPTLRPDDRLLQSLHREEKQQERAPQQIYPILFLEIQPRSQRQRGRRPATLSPDSREQVWEAQRAGWCLRLVVSSSASGPWVHCVLVGTPPPSRGTATWTTYTGSQAGVAPAEALGLHSLACDVPHSGWLKPWVGAGREKGAGTQKGPVWTRPPSGEQLLGRRAMTGSEDLGWAQPGSPGPGDTHCPKPRGAVHCLVGGREGPPGTGLPRRATGPVTAASKRSPLAEASGPRRPHRPPDLGERVSLTFHEGESGGPRKTR